MERNYVESSMINSIGYDANASVLEIEFTPGPVWQYYDFPESVWYQFEQSGSKGKFPQSTVTWKVISAVGPPPGLSGPGNVQRIRPSASGTGSPKPGSGVGVAEP